MEMASITLRGDRWRSKVKRLGYPLQSKTFTTKAQAKSWARRIETDMDNGTWVDTTKTQLNTVEGIIDNLIYSFERFGLEIDGPKRSALNGLKTYFGEDSLHDLTVDDILDFAAFRRKTVGSNTLQKQMYFFRQAVQVSRVRLTDDVVEIAIKELKQKKQIMGSKARDRRLEKGEYARLKKAAGKHKWIMLAVDIALTSGMRMGEIHALKRSDIDFEESLITLLRKDKDSEGGKKKAEIPLWDSVREVLLRGQNYFGEGDTLFKIELAASISDKFAAIAKKAGIHDLHFHDLRHEAISRMFEPKNKGGRGMKIEEVKLISGHTSFDQLARYVNLRARDLRD
jgi:integrase|tara:strand:+ start:134 stop:1156 length:1023 start_codon:yes stop_codon:yes gene_type:complete